MRHDRYDVVVIGGGPAGAMAAKGAAEKGAKVLLLERDPVIGTPVRCGEGVGVYNIQKFIPIDPRWIAAEINRVMLYAPDGTPVEVHGEQKLGGTGGAILERCLFDRALAEAAAKSGAEILTRADVEGLIIENGTVTGVNYSRFKQSHTVKAGMVVGADGVESRVGRWAGLQTQIFDSDLESTYSKVLSGIEYDPQYAHFWVGHEVAPGGYIWVFPKGPHTANVGIGVEVRLAPAATAYKKLTAFIKKQFGNPAVVGEFAGGVPCALPLKKPYANGIILAGDAARHCNPLTGGGIYTAMVSGFHAGSLSATAVAEGNVTPSYLKKFDELIENDIIIPHKRAYKLASAVRNLTDDMMNRAAKEILSLPHDQRTMRNIFLKGLMHDPKLVVDIVRAFL